ncbi:peritrophin-48 [Drosophila mauritiana]|uniref:Peritrophin-48 n=1 Tax=Drosophila mauritiana TaxID=7226 RepID=A0A6P8K728_DROMA|nr:peritrophin-48 [Drosophila mauritiana]
MTGKLLLATILCLMGGQALGDAIVEGNYNVTAVCTAVKVGTQLGSIESCQTYYVCQSTGPVQSSCQSGFSYDYKRGSCYPSSEVDCYWGVENPCGGKNNTWVPNTAVCGGWFYCLEGKSAGSGNCPVNQKFDTTTMGCVYGSCSNTQSTDGVVLGSLCDVVPPGQYFGDTESCSIWHYCESTSTGLVLQSGTCSTNGQTAYSVLSNQCTYESASVCSRVTNVPLSDAAVSCSSNGAKSADSKVCGTYYVCTNGKNVATDCPSGYYYDVESENCVTRQSATPVEGCNRCQYATTMFVNAVDSDNCSTYYYCNSQGQATLNTCPADTFFDESSQGCKPDDDLSTYVPLNGACKGATVDGGDNENTTEGTE